MLASLTTRLPSLFASNQTRPPICVVAAAWASASVLTVVSDVAAIATAAAASLYLRERRAIGFPRGSVISAWLVRRGDQNTAPNGSPFDVKSPQSGVGQSESPN